MADITLVVKEYQTTGDFGEVLIKNKMVKILSKNL